MKNYNLKSITRIVLALAIAIGFSATAMAQDSDAAKKKTKYTGPTPSPCVNLHNGSIAPVGAYIFNNKFLNINKDRLFTEADEIDFTGGGARKFGFQESQTAFRTGIVKKFDVRLIFSTFQKRLDRKTPTSLITDINSGFGDAKIFGRYGILSQKTAPFNLIVGVGTTIPLGSTDAVDNSGAFLPGPMQLGSGAWSPLFELGMHKVMKRHWVNAYFMYMFAQEGEVGPNPFTRPAVFKYNVAYAFAVNKMFDIAAEINAEVNSRAQDANGDDLLNTGGHVVFFSPEIHFKFAKGKHLSAVMPIPMYQNYNGTQLAYSNSFMVRLGMRF